MIFVIDASIAVKWFVDEDRRDKARELLRDGVVRWAPDVIFSEVANALRKKVQLSEITEAQALLALDDLPAYLSNVISVSLILHDAFKLSLELSHPIADCLYLACAQYVHGLLVSDDEKFIRKCQELHSSSIVRLTEWGMPAAHQLTRTPLLDEATEAKLIDLSGAYQQARSHLGRHWFRGDVAILAEHALKDALLSLDNNQRAYLLALCWFGRFERWERDATKLKAIWLDQLSKARADGGGNSDGDLIYLIASLQDFEVGLHRLSLLPEIDSESGA